MRACAITRPRSRSARLARAAALLGALLLAGTALPHAAAAQSGTLSDRLTRNASDPNARMLVRADEIVYDYDRDSVSAVGNVQIYYQGRALQADRVTYYRKAGRVRAEGNVRLTEPGGNVVRAADVELTEDLREGFVNSLLVETAERARFGAARATRSSGDVTVFDRGVYTACEPCKEHPERPPLWQVKAARIILKEQEKMVYYEDARLEFMGVPIAYLPYFSHPDPSVKRKTGFLAPRFIVDNELGGGVEVPFFWALAPHMDFTFSPLITTRQGPLLKGEWRHQLIDGAYSIRGAGIFQADPSAFPNPPRGAGDMDARGAINTTGEFDINARWKWGWQGWLLSDKWVLSDYKLWNPEATEAVSTLYLTGQSDRSFFDMRGYYFLGLVGKVAGVPNYQYDQPGRLPVVHPVIDHDYVWDNPVLGGEASLHSNVTSLTRDNTEFILNPKNVPIGVRGAAGNWNRLSSQFEWRRQMIDSFGQVFTPFAYLRGDIVSLNPGNDPLLPAFLNTNEDFVLRGMGAVGLEYRYPFVAVNSLGTHTIEPIAQLIARPNETQIGSIPNEDAQSLFFDDSNLFEWDKFSGWDRVEGGTRANVGVQYTWGLPYGGTVNALFGQSFHIAGRNSFAYGGVANVGPTSGLARDESDYVARLGIQPVKDFAFSARGRFDEQDWSIETAELEARGRVGPVTATALYGRYNAEAPLGFYGIREGILGTAKVSLFKDWYAAAGARYDLDEKRFDRTQLGIGYLDDCFGLALNYSTDWTKDGNRIPVHTVYVQLTLRTLGEAGFSTQLDQGVLGERPQSVP